MNLAIFFLVVTHSLLSVEGYFIVRDKNDQNAVSECPNYEPESCRAGCKDIGYTGMRCPSITSPYRPDPMSVMIDGQDVTLRCDCTNNVPNNGLGPPGNRRGRPRGRQPRPGNRRGRPGNREGRQPRPGNRRGRPGNREGRQPRPGNREGRQPGPGNNGGGGGGLKNTNLVTIDGKDYTECEEGDQEACQNGCGMFGYADIDNCHRTRDSLRGPGRRRRFHSMIANGADVNILRCECVNKRSNNGRGPPGPRPGNRPGPQPEPQPGGAQDLKDTNIITIDGKNYVECDERKEEKCRNGCGMIGYTNIDNCQPKRDSPNGPGRRRWRFHSMIANGGGVTLIRCECINNGDEPLPRPRPDDNNSYTPSKTSRCWRTRQLDCTAKCKAKGFDGAEQQCKIMPEELPPRKPLGFMASEGNMQCNCILLN